MPLARLRVQPDDLSRPARTGSRAEIEGVSIIAEHIARGCHHRSPSGPLDPIITPQTRGYGHLDLSTTIISRKFRVVFPWVETFTKVTCFGLPRHRSEPRNPSQRRRLTTSTMRVRSPRRSDKLLNGCTICRQHRPHWI